MNNSGVINLKTIITPMGQESVLFQNSFSVSLRSLCPEPCSGAQLYLCVKLKIDGLSPAWINETVGNIPVLAPGKLLTVFFKHIE